MITKNILHGLLATIVFFTNQKGGVGFIFAFILAKLLINRLNKKQ